MQALVFASLNSNFKVDLRACWLLLPLIFQKKKKGGLGSGGPASPVVIIGTFGASHTLVI